ncbi:MAG: efflux RND transporter periplasmic adaptor subunit [Archangium sp.]|nr:efflux RND transporter periplasmic adaptor subunit [Archangium sp.]
MKCSTIAYTALGALALTGCAHESHEAEEKGKLAVTTPLRKSTELTREYVAQVRAIQHIEVRALERGYLQGIFVDEGQSVHTGHRMFQLMPLIYQAEVLKSQAEVARSEIEYSNTKALADKNVVSVNELALAKANLDKEKAQLSLATTHKGLTEIRAPFNGIVGLFRARLGSLISEGDLLTTLSDNSTVWVYFNVAEAEYLEYRTHATEEKPEVKLLMANQQVFDQLGKVETIEADFNNETGTIAFRATFLNPKGLLRHGQTGKIRMTVPVKDALLIPQKATFDVLDKRFVFVVDDKNVVHARPITIAAELPQVYVVANGLADNERVLLDGLRKVRDGSVIEPDFKKPAEVFEHLEVPAE